MGNRFAAYPDGNDESDVARGDAIWTRAEAEGALAGGIS